MRANQLRHHGIEFSATKNCKNPTAPTDLALLSELRARGIKTGFLVAATRHSQSLERSGIKLPDRQPTHALRHSFASHFMMNGGNFLALLRILGHLNLKITMRHAYLSPKHLTKAVTLNPLSRLKLR